MWIAQEWENSLGRFRATQRKQAIERQKAMLWDCSIIAMLLSWSLCPVLGAWWAEEDFDIMAIHARVGLCGFLRFLHSLEVWPLAHVRHIDRMRDLGPC
jgi:hypothetical protein